MSTKEIYHLVVDGKVYITTSNFGYVLRMFNEVKVYKPEAKVYIASSKNYVL